MGDFMPLSDLASIGSLVSGLAVLVSLIFLYFQLRQINAQVKQTEKNQRASLNQGFVTRTTDNLRHQMDGPAQEPMQRVFAGETNFTASELSKLRLALRLSIIGMQDAYLQHREGLLDAANMDYAKLTLKLWLRQPVFRALWTQSSVSLSPDIVAFVNGLIAETPLAEPEDSVARFQADLAKIKSS
jgi:hypothetical protein